jgi:pimeloyl-ACP methyl ester carboxylesterase
MPTFTHHGTSLAYQVLGAGQPIVLVHGAASSARSFDACAPILAQRRQVILPDLRGMGASDRITTLTATDWVEDLRALLDHLGVDTADVAGVSLGARIATRFALDDPDRVATLILDAPMVTASADGEAEVNRLFGPSRDSTMAGQLLAWHGPDWEQVTTTYLQLRQSPELQTYLDFRESLENLTAPLFITRGDADDPIHPISHALEFHIRTKRSELWVAPNTAFSLARFRAREWAHAVDQYIWSLDLGSRAVSAEMHSAQNGVADV